ncbi:V-type ATP synthase subunit D [Alteracholeplasma palmae J233]|uniref:V-type ATP synthase subunit D n=1 Tax=Alteracholeplasma palmae (strain ATCC 49389 / J233) TaxID=1318466 RepID=U4KQK3_ALTPJ|nr:V-type ATP synthase subunit D [Alteracholeplasma palmae]CCV64730.1 V-type ATP synthase subunit D [Alteracholeplasma palmae J233]
MSQTINPTRMELMKLKKQFETTKRGHKLLKDKQDELMHQFIYLVKTYKIERNQLEVKVHEFLKCYLETAIDMDTVDIHNYLNETKGIQDITYSYSKVMGVEFASIKSGETVVENNYSYFKTSASFDILLKYGRSLLPEILNLAVLESQIESMLVEIEKSKRRVNAIENIILKEINEQIHSIKMKLSDLERSNTIRMIKSKEIILDKNRKM